MGTTALPNGGDGPAPASRRHRVVAIPGDGIGQEVMPPALEALRTLATTHGFEVEVDEVDWGCGRYLEEGRFAPEDWLATCGAADALLLGAVGDPRVEDHVSLWELLVPLRQRFEQFVNLRPVRTHPGVPGALAGDPDVDVLIVRENTEGEYTRIGGVMFEGTDREFVLQESVFSRRGIERIVRAACGYAAQRQGRVVAATKSNGLVHSMPYWDDVVRDVVAQHDGIELELQHVDALAARFVSHPGSLDVVVASNLFGDVLSDLGAAVAGGLGLAPSANLALDATGPSLFEPVHGSAPDIVGLGVANPIAQLLSTAMMLDHLGEVAAARTLDGAVRDVLADGAVRPRDLGGTATTNEVASAVLSRLDAHPA